MSQEPIIQQGRQKLNTLTVYLLSLVYGIVVVLFDRVFGDVVVTPLLSLSWLMVLAFFRRPKDVIVISLILWSLVVVSLWDQKFALLLVRCGSFLVSSLMAVLFSVYRNNSIDRFHQVTRVIQFVPAVVVASDTNGTIIAASNLAESSVSADYQPLVGQAFPDVLLSHLHPTSAIRTYREWFQREGSFACEICLPGSLREYHEATVECSGSGSLRILLVFVKPQAAAL